MNSDSNDEILILRMRFKDLNESPDEDETAVNFIKEVEASLVNDFTLKGYPEITKVYAKKYAEQEYDPETETYN